MAQSAAFISIPRYDLKDREDLLRIRAEAPRCFDTLNYATVRPDFLVNLIDKIVASLPEQQRQSYWR